MWDDLFRALALLLVLEGLFPFLSPAGFRQKMQALLEMNDRQIRMLSLFSMAAGLLLLYWFRA
jgi:uncharacterized protein